MNSEEALYPIREVSNLTGVNSITLRAWERRYGLIEPVRTEGGHRLYTLAHIERIKAAVKLTEEGIPISQVKARLKQMATQVKDTLDSDDYDYESKLKEACVNFDLEGLNAELDQIFMDLSDRFLFATILQVSKQLTEHENSNSTRAVIVFWESQLLPRLYTRLRFASRHIASHSAKSLWLQGQSEQDSTVVLVIAAIRLAEKGMNSIISTTPQQDDVLLFENIKASLCQGLVIVDMLQQFDETRWSNWVEEHPGLELHYFMESADDNLNLSRKIQCYAYRLD
ncbi:MerR family transcriptional regulator [Thiomicrorhabdus immobilis]|nr:MerR family transcriptional regulator [Thiomicrorhabdus immobilis]